jgi:hypothetical protein
MELVEKQLKAAQISMEILRTLIYEFHAKGKKLKMGDDVIKMAGFKYTTKDVGRPLTRQLFEHRVKKNIDSALEFVRALSL